MKGFVRRLTNCKVYYCDLVSEAKWLNRKSWIIENLFFAYRRQIAVTEQSGNDLTSYQILIELNSSNFDFSHANNDGSDIRFYDGSSFLSYWIEKWDSINQEAKIWVKVPSILANSSTSFYMYYGNSNVTSASNGEDTFEFFDDFGNINPIIGFWCWFQDPRAVQYKDKLYLGYTDSAGNIFVSMYRNGSQLIHSPVLHKFSVDDHNAPAILVLPSGYLLVFYSKHNGTTMYCRRSSYPENISSWNSETTVITGSSITYPNPIYLSSENKIYLFYRGKDNIGEWSFVTSEDGGDSWNPEKQLFDSGNPDYHQYFKIFSNDVDTIYFAHSGHPNNELTSIYFFYYKSGNFYKADGTLIGTLDDLPFSRSEMDLVYDANATNIKAWIWDIAVKDGVPYIVFATFPSTTDHRYNYAYWNGNEWIVKEICSAGSYLYSDQPYYSGGIVIDRQNPNIVYLSKQINGVFEIVKAETSDGGNTWTFTNITSGSIYWNIRPVAVKNPKDIKIFWGYGIYESYTDFDMCIIKEAISSYSLSKWNIIQGNAKVLTNTLYLEGTTGTRALLESKTSYNYPLVLEVRAKGKQTELVNAHFCSLRAEGDWNNRAGDILGYTSNNTLQFQTWSDGNSSITENISVDSLDLWHKYRIVWKENESKAYQDDTLLITHTTNIPSVEQVVVFYESNAENRDVYIDHVFVRKYTDPEPSVSVGDEETP